MSPPRTSVPQVAVTLQPGIDVYCIGDQQVFNLETAFKRM